ncbi:hypothetical protein [Amycolatopsis taiwanensis]|uniref:hypothetical protein n=1 Tax=Amycolatopsis taiwanensis TaxID=342230 RepID=UPI000486D369|nr:hypothetical protein [Amycolatopsis taiwanensis]
MTKAIDSNQPDVELLLRRVDEKLARRAGDDPLPAETITAFADAVRPLLGTSTGGDLAAAELEHKDSVIAELRRIVDGHARSCDRLKADQQRAASENRRLAEQLEAARGEVASKQALIERYLKAVDEERADLNGRIAALQKALEERSSSDGERHQHFYPADQPGAVPGPCACGHPYPRAHIRDRSGDVPLEVPDAWAQIFGQLRDQLADWEPERRRQ